MDVIQALKTEHREILELATRVSTEPASKAKRNIQDLLTRTTRYVDFSENYILPELDDHNHAAVFGRIQATQKRLVSGLKRANAMVRKNELGSKLKKSAATLQLNIKEHLGVYESELIPRLRQYVSTEGREDLGEIWVDQFAQ